MHNSVSFVCDYSFASFTAYAYYCRIFIEYFVRYYMEVWQILRPVYSKTYIQKISPSLDAHIYVWHNHRGRINLWAGFSKSSTKIIPTRMGRISRSR